MKRKQKSAPISIRALRTAAVWLTLAAASAHAAPFAYVTTGADPGVRNVVVIDLATEQVTGTIPVDGLGSSIAVDPSVQRVYANGAQGITVINAATNQVEALLRDVVVGLFAASLDSHRLYGLGGIGLLVADPFGGQIVATLPAGDAPRGIAVSDRRHEAYVMETRDLSEHPPCSFDPLVFNCNIPLLIFDTTNNVQKSGVTVPVEPSGGLAADPQQPLVYVAHKVIESHALFGSLAVVDVENHVVQNEVRLGSTPYLTPETVAVHPQGTRVYVTEAGRPLLWVVDPIAGALVNTVELGSVLLGPRLTGVAVHPSGTKVYVVNPGANEIDVLDADGNSVLSRIPVGPQPYAFGQFIGPDVEVATPTATSMPSPSPTPTTSPTPVAPTATPRAGGGGCATGSTTGGWLQRLTVLLLALRAITGGRRRGRSRACPV